MLSCLYYEKTENMKKMKTAAGMLTMIAMLFGFSACEDCLECTVSSTGIDAGIVETYGERCGDDDELSAFEDECEQKAATNEEWVCGCTEGGK